jgi:hypothetical protein
MDPELPAARLILELLISSRLGRDDPLLKQAAELAREPFSTIPPRDSIRGEVSTAIETLAEASRSTTVHRHAARQDFWVSQRPQKRNPTNRHL